MPAWVRLVPRSCFSSSSDALILSIVPWAVLAPVMVLKVAVVPEVPQRRIDDLGDAAPASDPDDIEIRPGRQGHGVGGVDGGEFLADGVDGPERGHELPRPHRIMSGQNRRTARQRRTDHGQENSPYRTTS
ncbi:hypothetical protein QBA75_12735 [Streptomyces stelliscabiei]